MRSTSSVAYIRGNGRITRDSVNVARFSFARLSFILCIVAVLIATNPANETQGWFPKSWWQNANVGNPKGKSPSSTTSTWFKFWLPSEKTTNYGIFALVNSNRDATVTITGLLHSVVLCHRNSANELTDALCDAISKFTTMQEKRNGFATIETVLITLTTPLHRIHPITTADNLCHGTSLLDWNHLAYSTCRIVTFLLLVSMMLSFCAYGCPLLRTKMFPWLDSVLSLFYGIDLSAIARWNLIGYPALRSMERCLSLFIYTKDAVRLNMGIGCCILILGIGGTANFIGTKFRPNSRIVGFDGVLAACQGYNVAVGKSTLFSVLSIRVDNATYFWLDVGRLLLSGNHGLLVTVVAGGMLGHVFGTMHPHWLLDTIRY
jgi:hypothetical protein